MNQPILEQNHQLSLMRKLTSKTGETQIPARLLARGAAIITCASFLGGPAPANADGIYRNGIGARAMGLGGADTALADDPLSIMHANPAGLGYTTNIALSAGLAGGSLDGTFVKSPNPDGHTDTSPGVFPEGALTAGFPGVPVQFGLSVIPTALLAADWHYTDPAGGIGRDKSYGSQRDQSEITLLRSAFGVGYAVNSKIAVGASLGFLYNENVLEAPYVFQRTPNLAGAKTLLDLHTSGLGFDGQVGFIFRPAEDWQIGLSYHSESIIKSSGTASGNAYAQFSLPPGSAATAFNYNADVLNTFPQSVSAGVQWQTLPNLKLLAQIDWVNWSDAFHNLRIHLSNGDNATVNGVAGSSSLDDSVPLNWKDEFVYRTGAEWAVTKCFVLRAGYAYSPSPVPSNTLTPLTAAIFEHALSAGVGWRHASCSVDLGYEYDLPVSETVGTSSLLSGEYSSSKVRLSAQWLSLTFTKRF